MSDSGYTLIELLAVIAIIGVMAAVAVTSYTSTKQKTALDKAVAQLTLDLRRAQNMAMNTAVFDNGGTMVVPSGGYGINFDTSSLDSKKKYRNFADLDGGNDYDVGGEKINERTFDSGISIVSVKIGNTNPPSTEPSLVDINFIPPNPNVKIKTNANWFAEITIQYGAAGLSKKITVNGLTGQISVGN